MNSNFHTLGIIWYFFAYYVTRNPKFTFQFSIMSKWLAKHISTKVNFKFTIRKRHVYIGIGWPIWEFEMMIEQNSSFALFQLVTRINSQNRNETEFINVLWHIILYMNIGISNWHNWSFDHTNMNFLFISVPYTISDLQVPETL